MILCSKCGVCSLARSDGDQVAGLRTRKYHWTATYSVMLNVCDWYACVLGVKLPQHSNMQNSSIFHLQEHRRIATISHHCLIDDQCTSAKAHIIVNLNSISTNRAQKSEESCKSTTNRMIHICSAAMMVHDIIRFL